MIFEEFKEHSCEDCELHKNCRNVNIKPYGSDKASLYLLGEYPTDKEDLMNRLFVGETASLLKVLLDNLKINLTDIRYYNAVSCRPKKDENPTDIQIRACRTKVLEDVKKVKPKVIVAMGNIALKCLFEQSEPGIQGWHGLTVPFYDLNCWVVPVYNPEKVVKDGLPDERFWLTDTNYTDTLKVFRDDLRIIPELLDKNLPIVKDFEIKKLLKFEDVKAFFDKADKQPFITFDFETIGLKPYFDYSCILSCAFSFDGITAYSLPIEYYPYGTTKKYWNQEQINNIKYRLKDLLCNNKIIKHVHNLTFEKEWCYGNLGIDIQNIEDSMLQHYILFNRESTHNLNFIAFANFGVRWKNYPDSIMSDLTKLSLDELLEYNGKDVIFEYRIYELQDKQLKKDKILYEQYKENVEIFKVVSKMQFDGAFTNETARQNLIKTFQDKRIDIEKQLAELDSVKKFQILKGRSPVLRSSIDIPTILFDIEKNVVAKKTKKGNASIDKEVLNQLKDQGNEFCDLLLQYREYAGNEGKLLKSYTDCVYPDNRYHTNFYPVTTGRFGSSAINLQNLDKRKHPEIRQLICALPGYVLMIYDFGQLEARILAALSNDRNFIEVIKNGYDIHLAKAKEIFGEDTIKNADKKQVKLYRFIAKNSFVFASFYGSKAKSTASRLGVTEEKAQQLLDKLWSDFPGIKSWQDELLKFYKKKRYVEIPPGRRRYAPLTTNQILNTPVQGASSSIVCKAMVALSKRGYHVVLNCHDELVFHVKEEDVKYANEEIVEAMTRQYFDFVRDVPLEVEGSIGYDWYNVFPIKEVI